MLISDSSEEVSDRVWFISSPLMWDLRVDLKNLIILWILNNDNCLCTRVVLMSISQIQRCKVSFYLMRVIWRQGLQTFWSERMHKVLIPVQRAKLDSQLWRCFKGERQLHEWDGIVARGLPLYFVQSFKLELVVLEEKGGVCSSTGGGQ